jgi:hypothetical protein
MDKINSGTRNMLEDSLVNSLSTDIMAEAASRLIRGYDIHKRTGIPYGETVSKKDAASRVISDIVEARLIPHFITLLVEMQYIGIMGRKYPISNLSSIVRELQKYGYIFDQNNRIFIENSRMRITKNWGFLREGQEYVFSFLRFDIIDNTRLVRSYPESKIKKTFNDFHAIVRESVTKRNGRIWNMEGDGGLAAFHFSERNLMATLSSMDILHRLFMYNRTGNKLGEPLQIRMAVHNGHYEYSDSMNTMRENEIIKTVHDIESRYSGPNSVTLSETVSIYLDSLLLDQFQPIRIDSNKNYFNYSIRIGD